MARNLFGLLVLVSVMLCLTIGFVRNSQSLTHFLSRSIVSRSRSSNAINGISSTSSASALSATQISPTGSAISTTPSIEHPAFDIVDVTEIDEYGVSATLYSHKKSGAQVMSVIAPDENKVFGITLRTPPKDSTGLPHILEHSVLCGSQKYPVKEPFVDLLKGSLQNFLNAFTYPDRTCYPVASTNTKDFYNLVGVYLDAVLHPRAVDDYQVLQQEGWHYELETPEDPLTYKGVVYNEMKGVYSSPDSLLARATQQALFPDNTYGVDSGGDPEAIPDLTFDDFKNFHSTFYHPSNSRIYFYGDDDPMQRLVLLDEQLKTFNKINIDSEVKFQSKNKKPERLEIFYPVGSDTQEPKHTLTVNWLLNDEHLDPKEMLAISVLDSLLLGTSSAKLRKVLTESQLGESVTGGGLSDELLQSTYSVGLKGVTGANVEAVEALVLKSLVTISEEGFEEDAVTAAINTLEFRLREFNTGGFPRGLSLMLGMMSHWIYDKNAADGIRFENALAALKDDITNKRPIFQDLIKKYMINNEHRVTVEMKPDFNLEQKQKESEESKLSLIKQSMTQEQIADIIEGTKLLKEAQAAEDSPEAKATLPRLTLEDIEKKSRDLPITINEEGGKDGVTILSHSLTTSGILYTDIGFDFSTIDEDDLPYLPLFCRLMMEGGTETMDEVTLQRKIGSETGGIGTSVFSDMKSANGHVSSSEATDALLYFMIRGKAVTDKVDVLLDLTKEILLNANLNNQRRAVEMLKESKVRKETSVITSGHTYAASRLAAKYSFLGYLGEITGGITSVRDAGKILDMAENNWAEVSARLEKMRRKIVKKNGIVVNLTGDDEVLSKSMPVVKTFLNEIPSKSAQDEDTSKSLVSSWSSNKLNTQKAEGFYVPSQVNYVVKGGQLYEPGEKLSGAANVVSRFLSLHYLWDNVRVMGGAYGGFARFSETSGRFVYMSYRDPNLKKTLDIYDAAPDALLGHEIPDDEILQSIIGTVGDLDSPMSPDQKGYSSMIEYLAGETSEERQAWRDGILQASQKDFEEFGKRLKNISENGNVAVVGSQSALETANNELDASKKIDVDKAY